VAGRGPQLTIILLIVTGLAAGLFGLSPLLFVGALIMVAGSMACRWYVSIDISYLYSKVFDVDTQISGIPWGAVRCLLFTATGMLLLDGGLFKVADSFKTYGFGLPPAIEAPLMNVWDWLMFYCELGTFPICFAGLSANIVSIRRGAYLQPTCAENKKCCGTKIHYKADAADALKSGTWDEFQKAKKFRCAESPPRTPPVPGYRYLPLPPVPCNPVCCRRSCRRAGIEDAAKRGRGSPPVPLLYTRRRPPCVSHTVALPLLEDGL
jgi:hypothetical protein